MAHQKDAAHVDPHDLFPKLERRLPEVADAADPGVVEEHVDAAELCDDGGRERARLLFVRDVDSVGDALGRRVDVRRDDAGALGREQFRARPADAGARPRDDAHLAGEPRHYLAVTMPITRAPPRSTSSRRPGTRTRPAIPV